MRRVESILHPVDPFQLVEATGNLTFNSLLTTVINGDIRTNGDLRVNSVLGIVGGNVLASDGSLLRLTNAQYGGSYSGSISIADLDHVTTDFEREPVSISPSKASCPGSCPAAPFYDPAPTQRRLVVGAGQSLTLSGGDYVFCSVSVVAGGTLNTSLSATTPTRIFIDDPDSARCKDSVGNGGLLLNGNLNTVSVTPSQLQIYIAGNGTPGRHLREHRHDLDDDADARVLPLRARQQRDDALPAVQGQHHRPRRHDERRLHAEPARASAFPAPRTSSPRTCTSTTCRCHPASGSSARSSTCSAPAASRRPRIRPRTADRLEPADPLERCARATNAAVAIPASAIG